MRSTLNRIGLVGAAVLAVACSATTDNPSGYTGSGGAGGASAAGNGSGEAVSSTGAEIDMAVAVGSGAGSAEGTCFSGQTEDKDKDGWTVAQGDCNDCDANANPGAVEVVAQSAPDGSTPKPADENCDGKIDNVEAACDTGLTVADKDPMNAVKAVDLCRVAKDANDWGVVSAKWVMADGAPPPTTAPKSTNFDLGHGLLSAFGPNVHVQAGQRMLGLSSGAARQPKDPGYKEPTGFQKGYSGNHPQGFPKESPACKGVKTGQPFDAAGLEIKVRAPSNAHGFSFDFNFFTYEWPDYVCSQYNDFFVALLSPKPANQPDGNISFDSQGNPVSVNNAFVEVCGCNGGPPCKVTVGQNTKIFSCSLGSGGLLGTGFDTPGTTGKNSASTAWLVTKAPITPGQEISLRWAVYDSGDGSLDSTTLIDHWQWIADPGTTVGTGQAPTPK